jgi:hypothetical protein
MDIKAQIDSNTVIVENLNTPLSSIDRTSRQKINKVTSELLHTLDQTDILAVYKVFHPTTRQYTFFSAAYGTLSKIDHSLGLKASINKFKKIEITPLSYKITRE